ncbi:hypothetical protein DL93DRAFT_2083863 [Clavulina sp. PMI_390]|nr:hypothetical protein DL93DRAFT_2083863 [Clavulina sp. PMI_390]
MACVIEANPDVGGIGVRIAIYIQSLLPAMALLVEIIRGHPLEANDALQSSSAQAATSSLLTGMALVISAIIQHNVYGLSIFHALIVLNLGWIAIMGSILAIGPGLENRRLLQRRYDILMTVLWFKLSLMAGFGLWVMHNPAGYDRSPNSCTNSTVFWVLGKHCSVTSGPFRAILLTIYSLLLIPEFNATVALVGFILIAAPILYLLDFTAELLKKYHAPVSITDLFPPKNEVSEEVAGTTLFLLVDSMFILTTEMTIRVNAVGSDENTWGLGQTLAVFVSLIPASSVIHQMVARKDLIKNDNDGKDSLAPQLSRERGSIGTQTDLEAQASPEETLLV